uniref:LAGLIDADG endonuclease n=1 Tax=Juglanconis sp. TaxID=2041886 RepID=A0A291LIK3_9PEZI|nr:LAGLIDADG endonuclease [Juglanconis sp.]
MALILWADRCFGNTLNWLKLSNSGDILKILIPNYIRKYVSGPSNHRCRVISQNIIERARDHRGSKSIINWLMHAINNKLIIVKEQRVDGSWFLFMKAIPNIKRNLRCTLMDLERDCRNKFGLFSNLNFGSSLVKIPTKVFLTSRPRPSDLVLARRGKYYSTLSYFNLNPWFITGFADAEGSFIISIYKDNNTKLKWRVSAYFSIHIHTKDALLLELIQKTLGVGKLRKNNENTVLLRVSDIKELQVIVDHFKKYPLVSAKCLDFLLFEQCFNIIKKKEHLTDDGFKKILDLRASLNKGLSSLRDPADSNVVKQRGEELKDSFPDISPVVRSVYKFNGIPNPNWISGFATGDSSFSISIEKSASKVGKRVRLIFGTCLHIREKDLLNGIANYFGLFNSDISNKVMTVQCSESNNTCLLQIKNNSDIENKIIPFFKEFPILGVKALDFVDWCKVAELVKNKEHLNMEGLNKIMKIAEGINLNRKW